MTRHIFGGVWCSSAATYALRRTADDNKTSYDSTLIEAAKNSFYVDDMLHSTSTEDDAVDTATQMINLCKEGGFNLTKWLSNSKTVLEALPAEKLAKGVQDMDLRHSALPNERALGLEWDPEEDTFRIKVKQKEPVLTKRGLLSYVSSVYDPLGFVSPFVLTAKKLFQKETKLQKNWDDPLEKSTADGFSGWLNDLPNLTNIPIKRCILPEDTVINKIQLHHFPNNKNVSSRQSYLTE